MIVSRLSRLTASRARLHVNARTRTLRQTLRRSRSVATSGASRGDARPQSTRHDARAQPVRRTSESVGDPVTGALGWQVTASRRLAATVAAISGGKAHPHQKGKWQASIPQAALTVVVTGADSGALWCRFGSGQDSGVLTVAFAPWTAATVLKCPVTALPARGTLSARDVRITTRMGRTVRYLVPEFIPSFPESIPF